MAARVPTPLKQAIFFSGLMQKDIAAQIGISDAQLSRIVHGLHADDNTKVAIARVLDRPIDELWPESKAEAA